MKPFQKQYIAEVQKSGFSLALHLNGIDLAEFADQSADDFASRLNVWLRQGRNELTARFQPDGRTRSGGVSRLVVSALDAARRETELFDSGDTAERPISYVIDIVEATGSALETAAPVGSISDADRTAILAIVADLHAALEAKQAERLITLQTIQLDEKAIAVGLSPDASLSGYRTYLSELWAPVTWWVAPFDRQELVATPTALPGVVHVHQRSGAPAVRCGNGELQFSINPYVAKIHGRWCIVR